MGSTALKKPQLRGMLTKQIFRNLGVTFGLMVVAVVGLRIGFVNKRRNAYAKYYSDLDCNAMFCEMKENGVFQSCPPEDQDENGSDSNGNSETPEKRRK